jgi:hypothetical protein
MRVIVGRQQLSYADVELVMLTQNNRNDRIRLSDFSCSLDEAICSGNIVLLYDRAMKFCSQAMLHMLYERLSLSDSVCRAIEKGLQLRFNGDNLVLSLGDIQINVYVDSRNGGFTMTSSSLGALGGNVLCISISPPHTLKCLPEHFFF